MWFKIKQIQTSTFKNFTVINDLISVNGQQIVYNYIDKQPGVTIIPILPGNKILLVQQFRYLCKKDCWELPGGRVHKTESTIDSATRELEEETGFRAREIELLFSTFSSPGVSSELVYVYCAKNLIKNEQTLDLTELDIQVGMFDFDECIKMIENGSIVSAVDALAIIYANLRGKYEA